MNKKLLPIYILSALTYFLQGSEGLPSSSLFFYMKEQLNLTPEKIMLYGSLIGLTWCIKPLYGYLIDNYFSKKSWMLISTLGSIAVSIFLGLSATLPLMFLLGILAFASWTTAMRDVAVDGIMCVEGKANQETGKIQSIQWIAITIAGILVGVSGGYIAEKFNYQFAYLALIPFYMLLLWALYNYKAETTVKIKTNFWTELKSYKVLFQDKRFLLVCLFLFLYRYSPSFGVPLSFIERDTFHWSKLWMGTLGSIGAIASVIGAFIYYKVSKTINIKKWLIISVWLGSLTSLAYLFFVPITAVLYDILFSLVGMFIFLISMDWLARNTIEGKEATSFALLCGISNFSGTCSSLSGAWLYPLLGLKWLIIISALTSFLCLPLLMKIDFGDKK